MPGFEQRYLAELEDVLRASVPEEGGASLLNRMMRYHLGWVDAEGRPVQAPAGKRLRPLFCLLACEGYGSDPRAALPAAAAVELLHNFTLIHDDVQDNSDERRHRPTVWKIWGVPQAINAGDALHALSSATLLGLLERGVPATSVVAAARLLDEACLRICEGQCLDIDFERRPSVSRTTYLSMIERKTAVLIGCALELGALVAGAPTDDQSLMRRLGLTIGLAYQIQDDVLGIWGDPAVTGKPAADDIRARKKTLPVIHAWERGDRASRQRLEAFFGGQGADEGQVAEVLAILESTAARQAAEEEAARLYAQTEELLTTASLREPARTTLSTMVRSLLGRPS